MTFSQKSPEYLLSRLTQVVGLYFI